CEYGGLICTDLIARGVDIPNVHLIIQVDPPQQSEFFIHRVGRTARMGRSGHALVFLRSHELDYLDLLRVKKVPIVSQPNQWDVRCPLLKDMSIARPSKIKSNATSVDQFLDDSSPPPPPSPSLSLPSSLLTPEEELTLTLQDLTKQDRDILVKGGRAFVAYIRAYSNHECLYIFRLRKLNAGKLANAMGLLYVQFPILLYTPHTSHMQYYVFILLLSKEKCRIKEREKLQHMLEARKRKRQQRREHKEKLQKIAESQTTDTKKKSQRELNMWNKEEKMLNLMDVGLINEQQYLKSAKHK
ncbi:hypothetical protein RFI_14331, partial [Reticulomyxa filosa]